MCDCANESIDVARNQKQIKGMTIDATHREGTSNNNIADRGGEDNPIVCAVIHLLKDSDRQVLRMPNSERLDSSIAQSYAPTKRLRLVIPSTAAATVSRTIRSGMDSSFDRIRSRETLLSRLACIWIKADVAPSADGRFVGSDAVMSLTNESRKSSP